MGGGEPGEAADIGEHERQQPGLDVPGRGDRKMLRGHLPRSIVGRRRAPGHTRELHGTVPREQAQTSAGGLMTTLGAEQLRTDADDAVSGPADRTRCFQAHQDPVDLLAGAPDLARQVALGQGDVDGNQAVGPGPRPARAASPARCFSTRRGRSSSTASQACSSSRRTMAASDAISAVPTVG